MFLVMFVIWKCKRKEKKKLLSFDRHWGERHVYKLASMPFEILQNFKLLQKLMHAGAVRGRGRAGPKRMVSPTSHP